MMLRKSWRNKLIDFLKIAEHFFFNDSQNIIYFNRSSQILGKK
jgi:hypothetical protein